MLLDTSAYSAFKRGNAVALQLVQAATLLAFNAVVLGELFSGFAAGNRELRNRRDLDDFLASSRVHVLSMGAETAERYAVIHHALRHAGTPIPTNDMWIAATAMEHGLHVATADAHFHVVPMLLVEQITPGGAV